MDKPKFNPKVHTLSHLNELKEQHGTQIAVAYHLGIDRFKLRRWIKKAEEYAKEKKSNCVIPTLNQLYTMISEMPDHIDYGWWAKRSSESKKHYNEAMRKALDLAREYQEINSI